MNIRELSLSDVESYARACQELHDYIGTLFAEGYDLLVIPSRGAHPFIAGAKSYGHHARAEASEAFSRPEIRRINELYLPFTADIADDQPIGSAAIRGFWARTLAAMLRHDGDDVAYRFYEFLRAQSGGRPFGSTWVKGGAAGKFVFIDTVCSGRAISEIFDAFARYGLDSCHFLLIVDDDGLGLRPEYGLAIQTMVARGRATLIHVANIFTEDQGPAMSGIWTVTMPEVMGAARAMIPELGSTGEIAASLYYFEVSRRRDGSNEDITKANAILSAVLYSAVRDSSDITDQFLFEFKDHVAGMGLQDQSITRQIAEPVIRASLNPTKTEVSGSHVIRAYVGEDRAEGLVRTFLRR